MSEAGNNKSQKNIASKLFLARGHYQELILAAPFGSCVFLPQMIEKWAIRFNSSLSALCCIITANLSLKAWLCKNNRAERGERDDGGARLGVFSMTDLLTYFQENYALGSLKQVAGRYDLPVYLLMCFALPRSAASWFQTFWLQVGVVRLLP